MRNNIHMYACIYMFIQICIRLFVYLFVCLSVCPSVCPFISLSIYQSLHSSICLSIYPSIYGYICTFNYVCVGDFSEEEVHAFLVECIQMKEFSHPHVMSLLGVSLDSGPSPYLVLPFMAGGSLLDHLKKKRSDLVLKHDSERIV